MGQLGQRVGLFHELAELGAAKEFANGRDHSASGRQVTSSAIAAAYPPAWARRRMEKDCGRTMNTLSGLNRAMS